VIDQIVAAIQSVEGARLLDRSSDLDHNRTVLTFAGLPFAVEEAAFRAIQTAAELIDLDQHTGEHPRIGATDVVPFVPLSDASMQDCMEIAKRVGQRVGEELSIPVYLYEAAATRPERTNLENIRKRSIRGLKTEIESDPNRKPDFGPSKLPKAGATVIGARPAHRLQRLSHHRRCQHRQEDRQGRASIIRRSALRQRLGLLVEGRAQVSMNLTNFRETPLARVVEFIRREAERYGVGIHHSELVGLIPQEALVDAAVWYTQLDAFSKNRFSNPGCIPPPPPLRTPPAQAPLHRSFIRSRHRLPAAVPPRRTREQWAQRSSRWFQG
jgi:glutamate formiminotransferase / formiminotetrahydrofolate cyclodeaminase